jgi:hypothetical protein
MKIISISFLLLLSLPGLNAKTLKFTSYNTIALDGVIMDGKITSPSIYELAWKQEIKSQLLYSIGQLNGLNGGSPDHGQLKIQILNVSSLETGLNLITYSAKLFIAWPSEIPIPENFLLKLPARGDYDGLLDFLRTYSVNQAGENTCQGSSAHDISINNFWYYYRPNLYPCALRDMRQDNTQETDAVFTNLSLSVSHKNTRGKFPEYGKIWEDGKLNAMLIFGKNKSDSTSLYDAGALSYKNTVNQLLGTLGRPKESNLPLYSYNRLNNPLEHPHTRLVFEFSHGEFEVNLYLIDGIQLASMDFQREYNELTKDADFISYNGHSGLGANIRALANMGTFLQGQYQLFLINGCDTFAYIDDALNRAHELVNPDFLSTKYIDIITNAMPSYFRSNWIANMEVIMALLETRKDYQEILSGFDKVQRAVVTGEEDNRWPLPFY